MFVNTVPSFISLSSWESCGQLEPHIAFKPLDRVFMVGQLLSLSHVLSPLLILYHVYFILLDVTGASSKNECIFCSIDTMQQPCEKIKAAHKPPCIPSRYLYCLHCHRKSCTSCVNGLYKFVQSVDT